MERFQIRNESLTLEIDAHGAEMKSLIDNCSGQEYLWCGDAAYWGRTSPVLFPLVGNYREKQSCFDGKWYSLSQHGFARDMDFELVSEKGDEIWFALEDSPETLEKYPFGFRLELGYRLQGRAVEVLWKVTNKNDREMYFSIGGHPAFNCPLREGEKQTDYRIGFDTCEPLTASVLDENGTVSERTKVLELTDGMLQITDSLFDEDALIVEHDQAHKVALYTPEGEKYLEVRFEAPLFGIWSPAGKHAPFVCIEPWYGRSDRADFGQKLEEREWGNVLKAGEIFTAVYQICV
ncbi:aldose 1-epimerase family protein [bacterium]|uniref:aldose 1-epimerase family protein n=1 Tax=Bariatricus sp. HCP3S3_E12 TaxID=3438906 RepID=UPI002A850BF2|nr:aldose 1-epimerase family protein [bacterium]MDY4195406.1 aldose 1-epimerase family protein [Bariatricus sp.]MDY4502810.1 aldose 1-epimerase family protein [Bariatricus sp.]